MRLVQVTCELGVQFGGISIILVGDFAQLEDKPLFHSIPSGNTIVMQYLEYRNVTTVVKLTENQRVSYTDQKRFTDFLIHLKNGSNTLVGWVPLLHS